MESSTFRARCAASPPSPGDSRWRSIYGEIIGALRIANDLERVGDLAKNIAKRVLLLTEDYRIHEVVLQLQHMIDLVRDQLTRVPQSYERRDVALALGVWRKDQEIDALNSSLFRELLTYMMEDPPPHHFL
jgi:phosphate transport system protein